MCSNYEEHLVQEQKRTKEFEMKVLSAEKAAERHKEELLKEIGFRKDMEEKWNEKKEEHKKQVGVINLSDVCIYVLFCSKLLIRCFQVAELTRVTECTEQDLRELRQFFNQMCSDMKMSLGRLTHEREAIHQELMKYVIYCL